VSVCVSHSGGAHLHNGDASEIMAGAAAQTAVHCRIRRRLAGS
jgi:hypothetical protein